MLSVVKANCYTLRRGSFLATTPILLLILLFIFNLIFQIGFLRRVGTSMGVVCSLFPHGVAIRLQEVRKGKINLKDIIMIRRRRIIRTSVAREVNSPI